MVAGDEMSKGKLDASELANGGQAALVAEAVLGLASSSA